MNRLKAAWNLLTKGYFQTSYGGPRAVVHQGQVTWIDDNIEQYIKEGYSANDVVYSICQQTGEKIKVAPWAPYKIKDESSLKRMQAEYRQGVTHKNYKKTLDLRTKALELYEGDGRLNELLKWPNEHESFPDLAAHTSIAKMLGGNRYVQGQLLDLGANMGKPEQLYQLPSQYTRIVSSRTYPIRVLGYVLQCGQPDIPFKKEEVLHDKYYNPNYNYSGSHLYGHSPLKSASMTLTNDNSSIEASTMSFQNLGPGNIVYVDDPKITSGDQAAAQAGALKEKWYTEYAGPSNRNKTAFSGYKINLVQMGLSPVDLAIIAQQKWNLVRFCNIWNFPHQLVLPDHSTYNNVKEAEKAMTSRCAMPLMTSFRDNFNRKLQTDWGYKDRNIYVDFDLSVYSELQQDQKEMAEWLNLCPWISLKQKYEYMQMEIPEYIDEKELERIIIPQGFIDLRDLGLADLQDEEELIIPVRQNGNGVAAR